MTTVLRTRTGPSPAEASKPLAQQPNKLSALPQPRPIQPLILALITFPGATNCFLAAPELLFPVSLPSARVRPVPAYVPWWGIGAPVFPTCLSVRSWRLQDPISQRMQSIVWRFWAGASGCHACRCVCARATPSSRLLVCVPPNSHPIAHPAPPGQAPDRIWRSPSQFSVMSTCRVWSTSMPASFLHWHMLECTADLCCVGDMAVQRHSGTEHHSSAEEDLNVRGRAGN